MKEEATEQEHLLKRISTLEREIITSRSVTIESYLQQMFSSERYQDPKRLTQFQYQVFSQSGEDGIIAEIFKRTGTTNKFFVEIGAGNGIENNTAALLMQGWCGVWCEADQRFTDKLKKTLFPHLKDKLTLIDKFITIENIETLLKESNVPKEPDLISIDIDGNDYWIWETMESFKPRVIILEYNGIWGPDIEWVMPYDDKHSWDGTSHYGASLHALEKLGEKKGYSLVCCNLTGNNSFFVRNDLLGTSFCEPYNSENHFESPRYFLLRQNNKKTRTGYAHSYKVFSEENFRTNTRAHDQPATSIT